MFLNLFIDKIDISFIKEHFPFYYKRHFIGDDEIDIILNNIYKIECERG